MNTLLMNKAIVTAGAKITPNTNSRVYVSPAGGYHVTIPGSSSNCLVIKSRRMNAQRYAAKISAYRNSGRRLWRKKAAPGGTAGFIFRAPFVVA